MLPWLDVRAFGAVGDGTTDDTSAIQAALNSVPSSGGVVYLPIGVYKVTSDLNLSTNGTMLLGAFADNNAVLQGAILKAASGGVGFTNALLNIAGNRCRAEQLYISGEDLTGVNGWRITGSDGTFANIGAKKCVKAFIMTGDRNMLSTSHFDTGANATTIADISGADHIISGSWFSGGSVNCLRAAGAGNQYANTHITGNSSLTDSTLLIDASNQNFTGCEVDAGAVATGSAMIRIAGRTHITFTGGQVFSNSSIPDDTNPAFLLDDNSKHIAMVGVDLRSGAASNKFSHALKLGSVGVSGIVFYGNILVNCTLPWNAKPTAARGNVLGGNPLDKAGAASVADGGNVSHGLAKTPSVVLLTPSVSGRIAAVTAISATTFTVALKNHDGSSVGSAETVYWAAEV